MIAVKSIVSQNSSQAVDGAVVFGTTWHSVGPDAAELPGEKQVTMLFEITQKLCKGSSRCPRYPNMWYEDAVRWAREGIEWLLGDRRIDSPAGPKSRRKLPPDCGQAPQGTRKTGNPPPVQISSAAPIC